MKNSSKLTTFTVLMLIVNLLFAQKAIVPIPKDDYWIGNGKNIYYNAGNVGIGTDSPEALLHLSKAQKVSFILETPRQYGGDVWEVANDFGALKFNYGTEGYPPLTEFTFLRGGKFGIGTENPEHNLDVVGNTRIKTSINSDMLDVVNDAPANTVDGTKDLIWGRYTNLQSNNPGLIRFTTWADGYKREIFQVRNNGYMFLGHKSTGNYQFAFKINVDNNLTRAFSIYNKASGSYVPEFMIYGNGKVYCREVTVTSGGWADNVFYDNYKLPTLKEIEAFIIENGHLPEIPSEKEISQNGLNTGEMLKKQMQKIEELTLYTIQQQKEIDELKMEFEKLKNKN